MNFFTIYVCILCVCAISIMLGYTDFILRLSYPLTVRVDAYLEQFSNFQGLVFVSILSQQVAGHIRQQALYQSLDQSHTNCTHLTSKTHMLFILSHKNGKLCGSCSQNITLYLHSNHLSLPWSNSNVAQGFLI